MIKHEWKKYSQKLNLFIAVSGSLVAGLPLLKDDLGSFYGLIFVATSVLSAWCVAKRQNLKNAD